jgi:transposase
LEWKPKSRHRPRKLDGEQEARLIAMACSPAPEGRARWTLRLLADKLVELEIVDSIGKDAVHRVLKKTSLSPG